MQFTALSTVSFADIDKGAMSDANGLSNMIGQLVSAAGITLGAMAVRFAETLTVVTSHPSMVGHYVQYQIAFGLLALVSLASLAEMVALPVGAGNHFIDRR